MKVLVNKPIHPHALETLEQSVQVVLPFTAAVDEVKEMLSDVDALLLCAGLNVGRPEIERAPNLRVIGRHGVGLDNVDVTAATELGLPVVYTPYGPTESTAEHAFLLMMAAARRLPQLDQATRTGNFRIRDRLENMGIELKGKALGVAGFGRIGRRLGEMCRAALDMSVYVYDPYLDPQFVIQWGAVPISNLVELAGRVDVLSLHLPATEQTKHIVNQEVIMAMKPRAILVNAARGTIVDEAALCSALQQERIFGAGIDVYDPEPPSLDNPLFQVNRLVLTPHVASLTEEARELMGMTVVENILQVLNNQEPQYLANPEVWPRRRFG